ncbi:MAG TPA: hypothetical protein IAA76_00350 [Candidatus Ornithospirochaeta stercorigallinarum]|nr:hypothetical protein [Candidatus Ornithospirochaeta stercorigallinarum]
MKVELKDIFNISEVENDHRKIFDAVDEDGVAVIYKDSVPKYVVIPYSREYEINDQELIDWDGPPEELEEINRLNEALLEDLKLENNPI